MTLQVQTGVYLTVKMEMIDFNLQFAVLGFGLNMKIKLITCRHNFALFRLLSPYSRFLRSLVSSVNLK